MSAITSRDNPRVRRWQKLARDVRERRKQQRVLIEGEHLVEAFLDSGGLIEELILSRTAAAKFDALARRTGKIPALLSESVFQSITDTESPSGLAVEISIPKIKTELNKASSCIFLEGIQDAGNVGAILRSAAAFGIRHAVLGRGCADAWSPKVLRSGMGAHFAMGLVEGDLEAAIERFGGKLCCTVPRAGISLREADLAGRVGWLFGAEGQGVSATLVAQAQLEVTIPMPGGAESLNVAAAAAICFYEWARRSNA